MQMNQGAEPTRNTLNCLSCPDCKGLCFALFDLALLPEMVLQRSKKGT